MSEKCQKEEQLCFLCQKPSVSKCKECRVKDDGDDDRDEDEIFVNYCSQLHLDAHQSASGKDGVKQCNPIKVVHKEGVGRCLVAAR